ncbi:MAG: amino acid ABC transporter permease [Candidatus Ancillula sp.]|jgi:polar amino acid transport system permease protein|nr:amino acid ABC transporter permease [Candidatus Ancillula sp.]
MELFEILGQGNNFWRLLVEGFGTTLFIALSSSALAIILGFPFGFLMKSKRAVVRILCKVYLEFFRLMPQMVLLFVFYFSLSTINGVSLSAIDCSIIIFSLWGVAEMGDIVRAAISSVAIGQIEAGKSLGLTKLQLNLKIVLPETLRRVIPPSVNLITRIIKTTPIVYFIGVLDVKKVADSIINLNRFEFPNAAFYIYGFIILLFFFICFALSHFSKLLERKLA